MPTLGCSTNAAIAYDFFVSRGLLDFQAAAIVGNLQQESRIDPLEHTGDGGKAHGIAQWGPPRWNALVAAFPGRDPWTLETQLEFIWYELENNPATGLDQLKASSSIEEATTVFQDLFEICGDCNNPGRVAFAKSALYACPSVASPVLPKHHSAILPALGAFAASVIAGFGVNAFRKRFRR